MGKYQPILTIARCGSFNKAAGELGYSQPNLWHIVNNLEDELGTRLFHRYRQGVTLTDAGGIAAGADGPDRGPGEQPVSAGPLLP